MLRGGDRAHLNYPSLLAEEKGHRGGNQGVRSFSGSGAILTLESFKSKL